MTDDFALNIWDYYRHNKRIMPWRQLENLSEKDRGYRVLVSEMMLQQTQVSRVIDKYEQWIRRWPTIDSFTTTTLADVLVMWSGLGYNRRAKYIYDSLNNIQRDYSGVIPNDVSLLQTFPGIGPNTAAAIIVYTYNRPIPFVETNIRTVYLHSFFANISRQVTDKEILLLVADTIDNNNPREWFYALMDYGTFLKKNHGNNLYKAKAHKKQSKFTGSNRQIRGKILYYLTNITSMSEDELIAEIADERLKEIIKDLVNEGLIIQTEQGSYTLPNR